ncbi:MAG TPA: M48 family metallopeptidase, partial [Chthoniobacteraceae bacterium]|nr:M48 family metallopeptidase [Chthoniobacteraceae bacterium]
IAFFMVKPLFARRARRMDPIALNPEVEPHVYQLVHDVCAAVGAPAPLRIQLDCDLNASASFDRGWRGMLGHKLVLTLGMPLLAGLTQRELAGVIAHEFGHFRQGAGMRLSFVIRRINFWFVRVIYQRDSWDAALANAGGGQFGWWEFMLGCARLGVWFSRRVLWCLMMLGHTICAFLMRQMEYDADRCEIRLAGSAAFESTAMKFATLGSVMSDLNLEMRRNWRKHFQLPDNLPVLVEYRALHMPADKREKIEGKIGLEKTRLLDTHPSAADRIRQARRLAEAGYDISDAPVRDLFENFDTICRLVTLAHYEDDLNVPTTADFLIPVEQLVRAKRETPAREPPPQQNLPAMQFDTGAIPEGQQPSDSTQ